MQSVTELKIEFLGLIQKKKYDQAQELSNIITLMDPNNAVIAKFKVFLDKFKTPCMNNALQPIVQKLEALHDEVECEEEEEWYEENQVDEEKDEEEDEEGEDQEDSETVANDEEEMGYGYYDPENPSYDQEAYLKQKEQFLKSFQDQNDLSTNIQSVKSVSKEINVQNSKVSLQAPPKTTAIKIQTQGPFKDPKKEIKQTKK